MLTRLPLPSEDDACFAPGQVLDGLRDTVFVYGPNGSGKSTLARACAAIGGVTHVFDRHYVDEHFHASGTVPGVFTLGEDADAARQVEELTRKIVSRQGKVANHEAHLHKEGGLLDRQKRIDDEFATKIWDLRRDRYANLRQAFPGLYGDKSRFLAAYRDRLASRPAGDPLPLDALGQQARTVFGPAPERRDPVGRPDLSGLAAVEADPLPRTALAPSRDQPMAALVHRLGCADWVRQGLPLAARAEGTCPFCQQEAPTDLHDRLAAIFDATYEDGIRALVSLRARCAAARDRLAALDLPDDPDLAEPARAVDEARRALGTTLDLTLSRLDGKIASPATVEDLPRTEAQRGALRDALDALDAAIVRRNAIAADQVAARNALTSQVWHRLIVDSAAEREEWLREAEASEKEITGRSQSLEAQRAEIANLEADRVPYLERVTDIQPTVTAINGLLRTFGFISFSLRVDAAGQGYRILRDDGSEAAGTLSEGERSFLTFLYFYHHVGGSLAPDASCPPGTIVIDDPVTSQDDATLSVVTRLVRTLMPPKSGEAAAAGRRATPSQVIVLTHNLAFHRKVSWRKDEASFWILRKRDGVTHAEQSGPKAIDSTYGKLWQEVYHPQVRTLGAFNDMRRIVEHYFGFLGGTQLETIVKAVPDGDRILVGALLDVLHDGSHAAIEDAHLAPSEDIAALRSGFEALFVAAGHRAHLEMMKVRALRPGA